MGKEKQKREGENVYDRIRRIAREKQEQERERQRRADELEKRLSEGGLVRL